MQTYTHLLLGTAMGKTLFHDEPMVNIVMIMAGSVLPDFVAIAKYVIDRMRGAPSRKARKKALAYPRNIKFDISVGIGSCGDALLFVKPICHFANCVICYALDN